MHGCVQVCKGVCGVGGWYVVICAGVYRCVLGCAGGVRVCAGMHGCALVCAGIQGWAWVCVEVLRCAWVWEGVCGMNFQNTFWRIES